MRGQVLVIFALLLVVLLGFTGVAIDIGRQNAEQRHIQTAADAAALAACRALIDGASDNAAATEAATVAAHQHRALAVGHHRGHRAGHRQGLRGRARRRSGLPAQRRDRERHLGSGGHLLDRRHDPGPRGRHPHAGRQRPGTLHLAGRTGAADRRPPLRQRPRPGWRLHRLPGHHRHQHHRRGRHRQPVGLRRAHPGQRGGARARRSSSTDPVPRRPTRARSAASWPWTSATSSPRPPASTTTA